MKRILIVLLLTATPVFGAVDFSNWHTPAQVDAILNGFVAAHPTLCRLETIGMSINGLPIKALKISDNPATNEPGEGDVVFMATHHAREWMSTETTLYVAEQLLTRYATDTQIKADVDRAQIWIIPVVNPDGYLHSTTAGNRLWRKNRRLNGDGTFGVDLNRNWGYQWGLDSGSSPDPWVDTYRGTGAWSEPEIVAIRNFLTARTNLKTVLSYHSYSELFLRPWSYTTSDPPGEPTLAAVVRRNIAKIAAVHGHTYTENIGYTSSGEATDYMWDHFRVASFTPEVRPATLGGGGFDPPVSQIQPTIEENFAAAKALLHDASARELWIRDYTGDSGAEPSATWTGTNWTAAFWTSPDITTVPATLEQGATVTLNVRIHNNSGATRNNVRLDVYYTDPRISLEFPNPNAVLIGSQTGLSVPAGGLTVPFSWNVPVGANSWGELHWCVGAIVMHENDMPLTTQAQRSSNVAIRNFETAPLVISTNLVLAATNFLQTDAELIATLDKSAIPAGWQLTLGNPPRQNDRSDLLSPIGRKGTLLKAAGPLLRPGQTIYLPLHVSPPKNTPSGTTLDVNVHAALLPLVPGTRVPQGNGFTYRLVVP